MASLGSIASAIKAGAVKLGSKVGTKLIPGVGIASTAYELFKPTALASEGAGYWGDDNKWHDGEESSQKSSDSSKYMTPISEFPTINGNNSGGNSGYGSGGSSGSSSDDKRIISQIAKGWDDAGDEIKSAGDSLKKSKNYITNLGKVKNQYITSLDNYKKKTDDAISGNKELIQRNQKEALDDLAADTRKSVDNTNIMLGIKGASGGSASKMASHAIAKSAGKQRAGFLTAFGDQISEQNQNSSKAVEEYNKMRAQADTWEQEATKQAWDDYNEQQKALDRIKKKKGGWEKEDIDAKSTKNLENLIQSIYTIKSNAGNFRANLEAKMTEFGGNASALDMATIDIQGPSELDTPEFSENIDLNNPENAEDWYNPDNKNKERKIKDYDALGNPIYEDELV